MTDAVTVRASGKAEMAYVGEMPWHGLGENLEKGASIETWMTAAGMDWTIRRSLVRYNTTMDAANPNQQVWKDQHVLSRSDNLEPLSIVSSKFQIVQPREVLEFFRDLVGQNGYELETAGTLFGGRRFWALASIGQDAVIMGHDQIRGYLLLSTACDGSMATEVRKTSVRVVCNNTLSMARSAKADFKVTHRSAFQAEAAKKKMGLVREDFREFIVKVRALAKTKIAKPDAEKFIEDVLVSEKFVTVAGEDKTARDTKAFKTIVELYEGEGQGATLKSAEDSLWGVVNAITEYVDHRAKATTGSHRLASAWFGRGNDLKDEAFARALALV
jgi:phage/plasmid-like protein (TIGR03299 family)